jgi:hypothetical protein
MGDEKTVRRRNGFRLLLLQGRRGYSRLRCGVLTRFAVEEFFLLRFVRRKKEEKLVPTSYLQEEYKIHRRVFLSFESLNSRKRRTFYTTSNLQGQWKNGKAKEAVESARDGLSLLGESVRKLRKEKKKTKEGEKVAPAKATFRVS